MGFSFPGFSTFFVASSIHSVERRGEGGRGG